MELIEKMARIKTAFAAAIRNANAGLKYLDYDSADELIKAAWVGFEEPCQAALTAIMGEGDGVQDVDREAAFNTGIRLTKREWIEVYEAFAQHRALAIAAERARIVAKLRDLAHESQRKAAAPIADAIERGEV